MMATASKPSDHMLSRRRAWLKGAVALCLVAGLPSLAAAAEQLFVDYILSNGAQRTAWTRIINEFSKANPDIAVKQHDYPWTQYERDFAARLTSDIDNAL